MRYLMALLLGCMVFVSCEKDDKEKSPAQLDGVYAGTFSRTGRDTVAVQVNLNDKTFSGTGGSNRYPAICNGSYGITQGSIEFKDACAWTADFDWTLILNGVYTLQTSDIELVFYRINGSIKDEYRLRRITR